MYGIAERSTGSLLRMQPTKESHTSILCHTLYPIDFLFAGSHLELHWLNTPRKILVIAKPSPDVLRSLVRVAAWLLDPQRAMHVYVEPSVYARLGLVSHHNSVW